MRCPNLKDIPSPLPDKSGWPWTIESLKRTDGMPDGNSWPKISIVTPSFNQGRFIEETIRSILLQGYPNLEYIIIDGGSSDETVEVIKKYERWLSCWVSEKDAGQADAINKGLHYATGEWFNWINSDDLLSPGALYEIASLASGQGVVAGVTENFDSIGICEKIANARLDPVALVSGSHSVVFHQPSLWLRLTYLLDCGGIDPKLHYVFDWEMLIRYLASYSTVAYTNKTLARFRLHDASKTVSLPHRFDAERLVALTMLRDRCGNAEVRAAASLRYRHHVWWDQLEAEIQKFYSSRWWSVSKILALTLQDPRVRLSRMTLGAIRQVLLRDDS